MARLTKNLEKWVDVPDDADNARIKIRLLKPGEIRAIEAVANPMLGRVATGGALDIEIAVNPQRKTELLVTAAVVDWSNFYGTTGKALPCNAHNKLEALKEFGGFGEFVESALEAFASEVAAKEDDAEKN